MVIGCICHLTEAYKMVNAEDIHDKEVDYWNDRSRGYSLATRMAINDSNNSFRTLLKDLIPNNRRLKSLDVGTGAGYAAIMLAQMGHDVLAIDDSEDMLEKARYNARSFHVYVDFMKGDVERPNLPKQSFDLIVAKDILWCLDDPVQAYTEWLYLLKPGGLLIIKDGNYYLDLYDDDYAKRRRFYELKDGADNNIHAKTNLDGVSLQRIIDIAKHFPLSRERRPSWDVSILTGLGVKHMDVRILDQTPYSVLTKSGSMKLPSTFSITVQAPYECVEQVHSEPIDDGRIDDIADSLDLFEIPGLPVIKALSDERRLRILFVLRGGSLSVGQISKITGDSQSLVSHNLRILKDANIVRSRRDGKATYYHLTDHMAVDALLDISESMMSDMTT